MNENADKEIKLPAVITTTIDYRNTTNYLVEAGYYDHVDPNINSRTFPVNGNGEVEVTFELVHLNKEVSTEAALAYLDANGMRPATAQELLVFGKIYPEAQWEFPVVALGSFWVQSNGVKQVLNLGRSGSGRVLRRTEFSRNWNRLCRFLAVRKSVQPLSPV